jgi:hypothetical protein
VWLIYSRPTTPLDRSSDPPPTGVSAPICRGRAPSDSGPYRQGGGGATVCLPRPSSSGPRAYRPHGASPDDDRPCTAETQAQNTIRKRDSSLRFEAIRRRT